MQTGKGKILSPYTQSVNSHLCAIALTTLNNNTLIIIQVALMTISLWFMAWTPYLVINYAGIFETVKINPLFTIWGSLFAKANAVYNPIVYGIR